MAGHEIVVIGASAGGVGAVRSLLHELPKDFPAAVFVVIHISPHGRSALPSIFGRAGALPARHPVDGEPIRPACVYVAPPDQHILIRPGHVRLSHGPKENHTRPAIDPLFRSAALAYGPRVIGVVLTGYLDDGTAGLVAVKARGGISVVQDPDDARYAAMPLNALRGDSPDHCVPLADLPELLKRLVAEPAPPDELFPVPDWLPIEVRISEGEGGLVDHPNTTDIGQPAPFVCPECSGTLFEVEDGKTLRFRCRVGHAYSHESLAAFQVEGLDAALWTALRALKESAALSRRLAERTLAEGHVRAAKAHAAEAEIRERQAQQVQAALVKGAARAAPDEAAG
ncbi:MAG TPA: chemotaxis protein CheB [Stellaceae bacterium]|jgi:two-component system chemotaxis response regulator CheB